MRFMTFLLLLAQLNFQPTLVRLNYTFFPGLLAKNQLPSVAGDLIEIPALSCSDMNSVLCPVPALRIYM